MGPRLAVAVLVGILVGLDLPGQGAASTDGLFAPPWGVTFQKIKVAMETRLGGLAIRQTRRLRVVDRKSLAVTYPGTLEFLRYRPRRKSKSLPASFTLEFQGVEGKTLSTAEFARAAAAFAQKAAFNFRYRGFRIADPGLAKQSYNLIFLAHSNRTTTEGRRSTYRMAVVPKRWDRGSWVLELDAKTGYPLYSGHYGLDDRGQSRLESELIVTSFKTRMRFPQNTKWWAPTLVVVPRATELSALQDALPAQKVFVVPGPSVARRGSVATGYQSVRSEVHIDPYKGHKSAMLIYSDGIDHVFVRQLKVAFRRRPASDTVAYWVEDGMTSCLFRHHGVEFFLVGRSNRQNIRDLSARLYARAVATL